MGCLLTLDELQKHFDLAREKLSLERREILAAAPLPEEFSRDAYSFSYMHAERIGLNVIADSLEEISWLPMQLDPQSEILLENKRAMKNWLGSSPRGQPDSANFGNDFIHALTRVALTNGWQSAEFRVTALRIGQLFHDLSCLIGLIYYGVWMAENGITGVRVSDPYNLGRTAKEISDITRSPEVARLLFLNDQATSGEKAPKKKSGPSLRVIKNTAWNEGAQPPAS
jgi:hypothetical protein